MFLPSSHTGNLARQAALQRMGLRATPFHKSTQTSSTQDSPTPPPVPSSDLRLWGGYNTTAFNISRSFNPRRLAAEAPG